MPPSWYPWGEHVIRTVQAHSHPLLDILFGAGSFLGEEWFYLLFLPLIYWCIDTALGRWLAYALLLSGYLNSALKYLVLNPRPPEHLWRNLVVRPGGPGFPSGHAQISATVWGTLAWRAGKKWLWPTSIVLVSVIAFSRIYNGVHYPHDVIGGLLLGVLGVVLLAAVGPRVAARASAWSTSRVAAVTGGLALVLLFLHPRQGGHWPAAAAVPAVATLWGMSVGFALERERVHFDVRGSLLRRGLRFLVGMVLVMAVYLGMRAVFPFEEPYPVYVMARVVRYGLVGLIVAWGAPALFRRFHL